MLGKDPEKSMADGFSKEFGGLFVPRDLIGKTPVDPTETYHDDTENVPQPRRMASGGGGGGDDGGGGGGGGDEGGFDFSDSDDEDYKQDEKKPAGPKAPAAGKKPEPWGTNDDLYAAKVGYDPTGVRATIMSAIAAGDKPTPLAVIKNQIPPNADSFVEDDWDEWEDEVIEEPEEPEDPEEPPEEDPPPDEE